MSSRLLLLAGALLTGATHTVTAQDFRWSKRIPGGKWLEVKGINGDIRAIAATGAEASIEARKTASDSDPESVEIRLVEHDDGVTACAVYPTPADARRENSCEPGEGWHSSNKNNDVAVHFMVRVPAGVKFRGQTVNGEVDAEGLRGDAIVATVNGSVRVTTTGTAQATTVNGSIFATMGRADWESDADFTTVNGGITLTFGSDLNTELKAQTVNGDIISDWPVTVRGAIGPKRVSGIIGNGGRMLHLSTVNGNIKLRKGS